MSSILGFASVSNPDALLMDRGAIAPFTNPIALRWSMITDMFGYYLLTIPLALAWRARLRPKSPGFADLYAVSGVVYAIVGAIGASFLSIVAPYLVTEYMNASGPNKELFAILFRSLWGGVQSGLWITLNQIPVGIWLIGDGLLLRSERSILGAATVIVGALSLLASFSVILGIQAFFLVGIAGGALFPLWLVWAGIDLVREPSIS